MTLRQLSGSEMRVSRRLSKVSSLVSMAIIGPSRKDWTSSWVWVCAEVCSVYVFAGMKKERCLAYRHLRHFSC